MNPSRRRFLKNTGLTSVGLLTFTVAGCQREMTPATARQEGVTLQILSPLEYSTLEALGDILVPGSKAAGLGHYIDNQLAVSTSDSMLMIKYLGVPAPYAPFYHGGLNALNQLAQSLFNKAFANLDTADAASLVAKMAGGEVAGWQGPPPGFLFFVLRSDAADVYYGTQTGFARLDIPYMAHIEPPSPWGKLAEDENSNASKSSDA